MNRSWLVLRGRTSSKRKLYLVDLKLAFHGERIQLLTSFSPPQYSVGEKIWSSYISRSTCASWKSKWLGESSNFSGPSTSYLFVAESFRKECASVALLSLKVLWTNEGLHLLPFFLPRLLCEAGGSVNLWVLLSNNPFSIILFTTDYLSNPYPFFSPLQFGDEIIAWTELWESPMLNAHSLIFELSPNLSANHNTGMLSACKSAQISLIRRSLRTRLS